MNFGVADAFPCPVGTSDGNPAIMKFENSIGLCKWLKIFDKSKPPDAKLANGGFALAKIFNPVYIN